ncbi:TIGR02206 family membrane protein [Saccharomonospora sp. NB11]|uniref:YwaF family protein n=1 Tax=Saccharomonospora sp. NB11 TaxID=1642298 RepID=UPI0018D12381|nr:TIGR02206 family membrane protein [Saccharomonospora sp. NB11]
MDATAAQETFTAYGPSHGAMLVVFVLGALVLVRFGRRHRHSPTERQVTRVFGAVLLAAAVIALGYTLTARDRPLVDTLPLHLSDLAGFVAAAALLTRSRRAFALTYYWCLTLSPQALFFPVLDAPDFPHHEFVAFWGLHLLVVWAAVYLTWGLGRHPTWQDWRTTVTITAAWAAVAMLVNSVTGTNYGYLNRKPATGSVLDLLGPWPWYVVAEVALILTAWALLTWPWTRRTRRPRRRDSVGGLPTT